MSDNYKDILQKLVQKYGFVNPEYVTIKSGPDHIPNFITTVTLNNKTFNGEISNSKKNAEKMAAFKALKYFNEVYFDQKVSCESKHQDLMTVTSYKKICLLIDSDNLLYNKSSMEGDIPVLYKLLDEITTKELTNKKLDIYIFMSKNNCIINEKIPKDIIKIISPNERSDSICMSTYIGSLLTKNLYDIYFIATSDEISLSLIEMIKSKSFGWNNKEAYQITKISQIYENL
jgi:hypothetical protein